MSARRRIVPAEDDAARVPDFVRTVGESFRFEVDDESREVTLVIVPFDARAIIPYDVFCRFATAVADVLGHLGKDAKEGVVPS